MLYQVDCYAKHLLILTLDLHLLAAKEFKGKKLSDNCMAFVHKLSGVIISELITTTARQIGAFCLRVIARHLAAAVGTNTFHARVLHRTQHF